MTNNILPVQAYTKKYLELLIKEFPDFSFSLVDESTIETKFDGQLARLSVDNAYLAYQSNPAAIEDIMASYIKSLRSAFAKADTVSEGNIIPVIKPKSFLNASANMGGPAVSMGLHDMYNDELVILYAMDLPNNVRGLGESDLTELGIKRESLREIAINNLVNLLPSAEVKSSNGIFMVMAGGTYESSLILHDGIITEENFKVNGEFVIAIPNRDLLLITGSNDTANVTKLAAIAEKSFSGNNYPISPFLYKRIDNKWQKWTPNN